jgi:hypothetical protein
VIPLNTCVKKFYTAGEYKLNPFLKCLMCLELEKKLQGAKLLLLLISLFRNNTVVNQILKNGTSSRKCYIYLEV